jgi:hypothetical protein
MSIKSCRLMLISFILQILICSLLFFRERKGKQKKATLKNIIYFLVFKFFEGFLGEAFFQESSPKRVPDKSQFILFFNKFLFSIEKIST